MALADYAAIIIAISVCITVIWLVCLILVKGKELFGRHSSNVVGASDGQQQQNGFQEVSATKNSPDVHSMQIIGLDGVPGGGETCSETPAVLEINTQQKIRCSSDTTTPSAAAQLPTTTTNNNKATSTDDAETTTTDFADINNSFITPPPPHIFPHFYFQQQHQQHMMPFGIPDQTSPMDQPFTITPFPATAVKAAQPSSALRVPRKAPPIDGPWMMMTRGADDSLHRSSNPFVVPTNNGTTTINHHFTPNNIRFSHHHAAQYYKPVGDAIVIA
jgi:hypothetical protein